MVIAGFVLMVVSAVIGLLLRPFLNPVVNRPLLLVGIAALLAGFGLLGIGAIGRNPFGLVTGGFVPFLLISGGALLLPLAVALSWGRV